jgi:hypothetical protein
VLQPFNKSGFITILMKGSVNAVSNHCKFANKSQQTNIKAQADRLLEIGMSLVAFCKRDLSFEESKVLKTQLESINLFSKTFSEQLENIIKSWLKKFELIGVLGLQKNVNIRNSLTA